MRCGWSVKRLFYHRLSLPVDILEKHFMCYKRVKTYLIQEVGGFYQLWPQRVEGDVGSLQLPVISLRQSAEPLPDGVVKRVETDGVLYVSFQNLQP